MQTCNLENLVATYHRYFSRQDNFRVGSAIVVFLRMRDLLPSPNQRLAALSLLHELYRSDSTSTNPFSLFFVECLQPPASDSSKSTSLTEQWFLAQILSPTLPREVSMYVSTCSKASDKGHSKRGQSLPTKDSLLYIIHSVQNKLRKWTKRIISLRRTKWLVSDMSFIRRFH